jgi:prefoldin subunit 5
MSSLLILETNLEGLNQTLASLNRAEKSRELSLTITKVEEAIMWLQKAVYLAQPTLFDNIPQEDPNQGRLFDDNLEPVAPKKTRKKAEPKAESIVITEPKAEPIAITQELAKVSIAIDDVRMRFKNFCQANGNDKGKEALVAFEATSISELYAKGDNVVINFYNSIV